MLNKHWHYVEFNLSNSKYIPKSMGVYLIVKLVQRLVKVPVGLQIAYVGKSTNLRKRFITHTDFRKSHNNLLGQYIKTEENLEYWYLETESDEIQQYESLLIKEANKINPHLTNKIKMKTIKGELYV